MLKIGIIQPDIKYRFALKRYLSFCENLPCLFAEGTVDDAVNKSRALNSTPDILLVEQCKENILSKKLVDRLKNIFNNPVIIILDSLQNNTNVIKYFQWGIKGYILKNENPVEIVNKIKAIEEGGLPLSPEITRGVINYLQKKTS